MTSIHLGYIVSCLAEHPGRKIVSHVPIFADRTTNDEARGYALQMAEMLFPVEDGYGNPHIVAREITIEDWRLRELYAQLDAAA